MKSRWQAGHWLLTIVLVGAALRLFPIWFGLPYQYARPDEETAIDISIRISRGDFNPRFFHWPSLTFYAFAAVFKVVEGFRTMLSFDPPIAYNGYRLLARGFVAVSGTLTIVALFRLGRRIGGERTGLLAAFFLAVAILHVRDSHFAMTDVLTTLLVTASLAILIRAVDGALARAAEPAPLRWFAIAGLVGGLAASTKYNAAAIVAAMAGAQVVLLLHSTERRLSARAWAPTLLFLTTFSAGFVLATPFAILDFRTFARDLEFTVNHLSGGHGMSLGRGWSYHLRRSLPYGLGVPIFVAAVAGIVPFVRHHRWQAIVIGTFASGFYVAIGGGQTVFFRYILPLVPVACLSAAVAVRHAAPWIASRTQWSERSALVVLVGLIGVPALVNSVWFDSLLARTDTRVLAAGWLKERLQPESTLYDAGSSYSHLDLRDLRFHDWYFDPKTNSFGDASGRTPDWLVFHESPLRLYSGVPWPLRRLVDEKYTVAHRIAATRGSPRAAVYDPQDAFFMPFSGFHTVVRPGPTIVIYRRSDLSR